MLQACLRHDVKGGNGLVSDAQRLYSCAFECLKMEDSVKSTGRRLARSYVLGPLVFIIFLALYSSLQLIFEPMVVVFLYVCTLMILVLPALVTILLVRFLPNNIYEPPLSALLYLIAFPLAPVMAFWMMADGLSSPRPDDPPFMERLTQSFVSMSVEVQMAFCVALIFAAWLVFPFVKSKFQTNVK